ncbi:hypothetical protein T11_7190, partial [Trichinella zimbabwensis]
MEFKTVKFIFFWSCVWFLCFTFLSSLNYFPFCSTMYNHRAKRYPNCLNCLNLQQIPDVFRTTKAGEDFLLWQSASRHILVFPTGSNIRLLAA